MISLPRATTETKLRAKAKHSPATMSLNGVACCCRWIISVLAKTLQRPATRAGFCDANACSPNSPSMVSPRRRGLLIQK